MGEEECIKGRHREPAVPSAANYNIPRSFARDLWRLRAGNGHAISCQIGGPDYDRFHRRLERPREEKLSGAPSNLHGAAEAIPYFYPVAEKGPLHGSRLFSHRLNYIWMHDSSQRNTKCNSTGPPPTRTTPLEALPIYYLLLFVRVLRDSLLVGLRVEAGQ